MNTVRPCKVEVLMYLAIFYCVYRIEIKYVIKLHGTENVSHINITVTNCLTRNQVRSIK